MMPLLKMAYDTASCPCCDGRPRLDHVTSKVDFVRERVSPLTDRLAASKCDACGWWLATSERWDSSNGPEKALHTVRATGAALKSFSDLIDSNQLSVLENEITLKLEKSKSDTWKLLEDVSGAILEGFGHRAVITGRSKDGGIDLIVNPVGSNEESYVQVKHYKNKVGVRVIRELVGVMAMHGNRSGLIVTSSSFTRGVFKEGQLAAGKGFTVELVDAKPLIGALRIMHRKEPPTLEDIEGFAQPSTQIFQDYVDL